MLFLFALLGTYFIMAQFGLAQESTIPPEVLMVNDLNCVIHNRGKVHQAICTASYLQHDNFHHEPYVISLPERKTEKAAYEDTVKWRKQVLKIQAAAQPVDVHKLKKEQK